MRHGESDRPGPIRIFLAGDVMLGRGVDQILPHPGDPRLYEGWLTSALDYIALAEQRNGAVPRAVPFGYVWGDLAGDLDRRRCDLRLINLETAITTAGTPEPKGINYRMHPGNVGVLAAAAIDGCTLANNHAMDWGPAGLVETLDALDLAGVGHAGAGRNAQEAARPLTLGVPGRGRVLVIAFGAKDSGVPPDWAAGVATPGVALLPGSLDETVAAVRRQVRPLRREADLLALSIHWGGNWGYGVPPSHRDLARALIDEAGADLIFGHSSHHPKGIELHRGKLILYGCGDLINDYEGIRGHEAFRSDLALGYVADLDPVSGRLRGLDVLAYRRWRFSLVRANAEETGWLAGMLQRESLIGRAGFAVRADGWLGLDL